MIKNIYSGLMVMLGVSLGVTFMPDIWLLIDAQRANVFDNVFVNGVIGAALFFVLSLLTGKYVARLMKKAEISLSGHSLEYLLFGAVGTILGLLMGVLVSIPLYRLNVAIIGTVVPTFIMFVTAYLGFRLATTKKDEWKKIFTPKNKNRPSEDVLERKINDNHHRYKLLDTSVIIDGRIYDIAKTGFIEGVLLIPKFVLYELQYIADSGDSLKRVRGRRGLDILNALQKEPGVSVEMYEGDFDDIPEVDTKLLKLAKMLDGVVVTNDYNLNKVAEFQNVPVLNINALANAVKPVVIPGEQLHVMVVKDGTERQQGVAYLDDGTMIVVEDGQHYMNKKIDVVVTSALQTAAGRMIFAKPVHMNRGIKHQSN